MDEPSAEAPAAPPARYVAPRTGLRQTRVGAVALALVGGGVASIAAAIAVPTAPFGVRDLRMPFYGGALLAALALVAVVAVQKRRWWLAPWFALGMVPAGSLVWLLRNGIC